MAARRTTGKASTPRLALLAMLMFGLGLGLGALLTSQSCSRKAWPRATGNLPEATARDQAPVSLAFWT